MTSHGRIRLDTGAARQRRAGIIGRVSSPPQTYEDLRRSFRWGVPERYNIAVDAIDRHAAARPDAPALIAEDETGAVSRWTFEDVRRASNRLANVLAGHGLVPGDRVAILLPQAPETGIAHVAAYRAGLIAVPLFVLFGPEAIEYRLADSGAVALITDVANWPKVAEVRERLPDLRTIVVVDGGGVDGTLDYAGQLDAASAAFPTVDTLADDPAIIIYTSGTTGPPKGALHAHRFLLGHMPGVQLPQSFPPQPGDIFWTPADWAWIGGLYDVLFPAWHWGLPVLAHRARKFDPERALDLMARHAVRNVFLPPTALKMIRRSGARPGPDLRLRSVASGGETLGAELLDWGRDVLGDDDQRVLRPDRVQPRHLEQRRDHADPARIDGPCRARARGRDHRRRRGAGRRRRRG